MHLQLSNGSSYSSQIDLTGQFDSFLSPVIYIAMEIRLGLMGMETIVTGWETGEEGDIEI
ncbi:hypothetical protein GGR21_001320 [Dysgonomonas hofstadii]|uniref:Uncharacterized protein n=1 Tax=Dysgonomonas hofstadii TaxID=637886 RepID=A0A840CHE3_9BACT|nr:hypothetical protein [Dysgonomonas hofstadii]MBB4035427.1 hypothetical protein [Dysgonomonas hofstadii]